MTFAALVFPGSSWWWVALAAIAVMGPLGWLALAPAGRNSRTLAIGLALRILAVGLLVICILDPQWTARRAVNGANFFAIVADNSKGLQIPSGNGDLTRGDELKSRVAGLESDWLGPLSETFQLRNYLFDRDLHRVPDFQTLDFSGDRTDLQLALNKLRDRFSGQPLAGILLFTDGNATDVIENNLNLAGLPPIYPVVVGDGQVPDVRIERAGVRQTAFDDAPVAVQLDISGEGFNRTWLETSIHPRSGANILAAANLPDSQQIRLMDDGEPFPVTFNWRPGGSGVQFYEARVAVSGDDPREEATLVNNRTTFMVDRGRENYRILYVGGRPSWEFKFLNRALMDDLQLQMVGLLRVARREPKFEFKGRAGESSNPMFRGFDRDAETTRYDQPVLVRVNTRDEEELRGGFPKTAKELFSYDAVIIDDAEAAFFTLSQLSLLREFVSERGGGLLLLGGADSLENGGYSDTPLAGALPVYLDRRAAEPPRGALSWRLTREGWLEPWTRIRSNESDERERLESMPQLLVTHPLESVKPGATVLAEVEDELGQRFPAMVSQRFGAGRVGVLAIGDLWRWGFFNAQDQSDMARFWRQMARWLVTDVPTKVSLQIEPSSENPDGVRLRITARDADYRPVDLASARLTITRLPPSDSSAANNEGSFSEVTLSPTPSRDGPGQFEAEFAGRDSGAYLAQVEVNTLQGEFLGRAEAGWVVDLEANEFRSIAPNRHLLSEIARRTGGEVIRWNALESFVQKLPVRSAPITEPWSYPLWNTAWMFLAVLACFIAEWIWRRWRGLP